MKKFVIVAGLALLAACGAKEDAATETAASDAAAPSAAATPAEVYAPGVGSYDVTAADGSQHTTTLIADGVYVERDLKGKVTEKGKWEDKDGKTCFTPDGGAGDCFTLSVPVADGGFTATDSKGVVSQVKKHAK